MILMPGDDQRNIPNAAANLAKINDVRLNPEWSLRREIK
jgi:hypothetical protein